MSSCTKSACGDWYAQSHWNAGSTVTVTEKTTSITDERGGHARDGAMQRPEEDDEPGKEEEEREL